MRFLSAEWLDLRMAKSAGFVLPLDMDLRVQHVVTDGPDGAVIHYFDEIRCGRLHDSGLGDIDDPDLTVTSTWSDELNLLSGELDPYVTVVEGRVLIDGDYSQLLSYLPMMEHHWAELYDIARILLAGIDE